MEELRIAAILFKVFPEAEYEVIDGAGGRIYIIAPNCL
jgi:hypothetical protein